MGRRPRIWANWLLDGGSASGGAAGGRGGTGDR